MKLSIYSLNKILFQGNARLLNCQSITGEITILDNHETFITALKSGTIKVIESSLPEPTIDDNILPKSAKNPHISSKIREQEHFFPIVSGFLEVRPDNEVRLIIEE